MFFFIILIAGCHGSEDSEGYKLIKGPLQGYIPNGGFLEQSYVRSIIDCATACAGNQYCVSTFYVRDTKICQLHSNKFTTNLAPDLQTNALATSYEIDREVSTTTPAATTVSTTTTTNTTARLKVDSPCPIDDSKFSNAETSNGEEFSFRIFKDVNLDFNDAISYCGNYDAKLYKILTPERMAFTQSLMSCSAYSTSNFWLNGRNTGNWKTLDDESLPMTSVYWYPGRPNNYQNSEYCLWMPQMFNHYLDDCNCYLPVDSVICELGQSEK